MLGGGRKKGKYVYRGKRLTMEEESHLRAEEKLPLRTEKLSLISFSGKNNYLIKMKSYNIKREKLQYCIKREKLQYKERKVTI